MDEFLVVVLAILFGLGMLLGTAITGGNTELRCIEAMKDKPAAEIVVVCK